MKALPKSCPKSHKGRKGISIVAWWSKFESFLVTEKSPWNGNRSQAVVARARRWCFPSKAKGLLKTNQAFLAGFVWLKRICELHLIGQERHSALLNDFTTHASQPFNVNDSIQLFVFVNMSQQLWQVDVRSRPYIKFCNVVNILGKAGLFCQTWIGTKCQ